MCRKFIFFIILFIVGIFSTTYSQEYNSGYKKFFNNWSANVNVGINQFYGDISNKSPIDKIKDESRLAYGIMLTKDLSPYISIRGQLLNGKLYSTKDEYNNGEPANLYFDADVFEYNISCVLNFSNMLWKDNLNKKFSFYGLLGMGLSNWKTKLVNSETGNLVSSHGYSGNGPNKRTTEIVGPIGLGINYNISDNFALNIESTLRTVNSDFLDAAKGGFDYDLYSYSSIGLTYKFNNSYKSKTKKSVKGKNVLPRKTFVKRKDPKKEEEIKKKNEREEAKRKRIEDRENKKKNKRKNKYVELEPPELLEFPDVKKVYPNVLKKEKKLTDKQKALLEDDSIFNEGKDDSIFNEGKLFITGNPNNNINKKMPSASKSAKNNSYVYDVQKIEGIVFRVQIMASKNKLKGNKIISDNNINQAGYIDYSNGWYKFSVGNFFSYNKAKRYCDLLYNKGFTDAFVVAYKDGVKVPLSVYK